MERKKVAVIAGARPNFIKVAPLMDELKRDPSLRPILVHTGQHYDRGLSEFFFRDLKIPEPEINLSVGSHPRASQLARMMEGLEEVFLRLHPDLVVVVGDVNSTLAGALTASSLSIPLAHVEAGLRSFDPSMPEEINRVITDRFSDLLFVTEESGRKNLIREGIPEERIFLVGNVMIDTLLSNLGRVRRKRVYQRFGLKKGGYIVLTLHRPSNVDKRDNFENILLAVREIQERMPVVYPAHPRARESLGGLGLTKLLGEMPRFLLLKPLSYLDFINLTLNSIMVLTDSGGIQEETTFLNIPCLTLRDVTERPVTCLKGTNIVVGVEPHSIISQATKIMNGERKEGVIPEWWDGRTSGRIVRIIGRYLSRDFRG